MARFGALLKKYFLVFAMLSLLLCLFLFLFLWQKREPSHPLYLVYTVVAEMDPHEAEHILPGMRLTDAVAKGEAGVILGVTRDVALREDAEEVYAQKDRVTLAIRVGALGRERGEAVLLQGLIPRVGETLYLYGSTRIEGLCVRVRRISL